MAISVNINLANGMKHTKNYLLNQSDDNVFAIDWSKGADSVNYFQSAADARVVGAMIAFFINRLIDTTNASVSDIHCIGHSLGAQICGFVGQRFQSPKLAHISGFDPAGPGFYSNNTDTRLDPSDAELVSIIHSNADAYNPEDKTPKGLTGIIGNRANLGHFDFWPNGGKRQPGCGIVETAINAHKDLKSLLLLPKCNHARSNQYPLYANQNGCQMIGYQCKNYVDFQNGICADCGTDNDKCKPMDFNIEYWDNIDKTKLIDTQKQNYYLITGASKPFCLFHYQIQIQMSENYTLRARGQLEIRLFGRVINITFPRSTRSISSFFSSRFRSKQNFTQLYLDSGELIPSEATVKWSSLFRQYVRIDKIIFNFMSHINESVRKQKSFKLCPNSDGKLSKGEVLTMKEC